jgi:hypothetical protein
MLDLPRRKWPRVGAPLTLVLGCALGCGESSPTADSSGDTSGQGGSSTISCDSVDDAAGAQLKVVLRNDTERTLFLGQDSVTCSQLSFFRVKNERGRSFEVADNGCFASCQEIRDQGQAGCLDLCLYPDAVALDPGQEAQLTWDARILAAATLPAGCANAEQGDLECRKWVLLAPDTFIFSASAGDVADCSKTSGDVCRAGDTRSTGGTTYPSALVVPTHTASATVKLDSKYRPDTADGRVLLSFQN